MEEVVKDWKLDPGAIPCIYLGSGEVQVAGHKSVMGYSIDFSKKGHIGRLIHST